MKSQNQQMTVFVIAAALVTLFLLYSGKYLMNYSYQRMKQMEQPVVITNNWR